MGKNKLTLLFQTLRHVKPIQLYYQLYYRFKSNTVPRIDHSLKIAKLDGFVNENISMSVSYQVNNKFNFLNLEQCFDDINWNFPDHGKLWTYNLNYFDFLNQEGMTKSQGLYLIHDFCSKNAAHKDAYEPYPISLRIINWVKFLSKNEIQDEVVNKQLYLDVYRLKNRLEYHILANHLFENGFGLLFGAYYFQDEKLYNTAKKIILNELKEQLLPDGAHYELAPMYHQIILFRILDSYQLVAKNSWKNNELKNEFAMAAKSMLGWLKKMQFSNGDLPMVNDSTNGVAPSTEDLFAYALDLGLVYEEKKLNESGYRKLEQGSLELLIDVGQIAPSYQPGHSHADNLQILVHKNGHPYLVDTGISTYEKNERRHKERSTSSHNTLTVDGKNSSEVWSGFRVGRRAKTHLKQDNSIFIEAFHDGYSYLGVRHQRSVELYADGFAINDTVFCKKKNRLFTGNLHFHPDRDVRLENNQVFVDGKLFLSFQGTCNAKRGEYDYCFGYNRRSAATKITYTLDQVCRFIIHQ